MSRWKTVLSPFSAALQRNKPAKISRILTADFYVINSVEREDKIVYNIMNTLFCACSGGGAGHGG